MGMRIGRGLGTRFRNWGYRIFPKSKPKPKGGRIGLRSDGDIVNISDAAKKAAADAEGKKKK